jgi:hypothetical protein
MEKLRLYLILVAIWVIAAIGVAAFPDILAPVAEAFDLTLAEAVAIFLAVIVILTIIFLALIGQEAGRTIVRYLGP